MVTIFIFVANLFVETVHWPPLLFFSGAWCLVFVSICYVILALLWLSEPFFRCFRPLGFSLKWFSTLVAFARKKKNAVPMQTGVRFLGWPTHFTSSQSTCIFRSFLILVVLILDLSWPVCSGWELMCFCYTTRTTIIYLIIAHSYRAICAKKFA